MARITTAMLLLFTIQILPAQIDYSTKNELKQVVKNFERSISAKDATRFNKLFFSDEVSFVGIMSEETENSIKEDFDQFDGTSVSDSRSFIETIVDSDKKFKEKIYNIDVDGDGMIASIDFDYSFFSDGNMKQWGHQKWNLVNSNGKWLITNAVYSVHFPNVEKCPFDGEETADLKIPTKRERPSYGDTKPSRKPKPSKYSKPKKKQKPLLGAPDEEEEEEEIVEEKPAPTKPKKTLRIKSNGSLKGAIFAGVANKVEINYKDVPPSKISIVSSVDNVEIRKNDDGTFFIKPQKGVKDFPVFIRAAGKTLEYKMKVDVLPNPRPLLSKKYSGPVNAKEFQTHMGLIGSTKHFPVRAKCIITSFKVTRKAATGEKRTVKNRGGRFQIPTQELVRAAKRKDVYLFEDITCQCQGDDATRDLEGLEFTIK